MLHTSGAMHPRGGSGMLTQALARAFQHMGGDLLVQAPVQRILVSNGSVRGVKLTNGEQFYAPTVISNAHVLTTMLNLVGAEHLPAPLHQQLQHLRVGNGFGMAVRCAANALPDYLAAPSGGLPHPSHSGMQLLCPSMEYVREAFYDFQRGHLSRQPAVLAMTFSAIDDVMAPAGKHTVFLWSQYAPYRLADGQQWSDLREHAADRVLEVLYRYAPNMRTAIEDRYIQTPVDLEEQLGLLHGNVMHVEMSFDQMFFFRPVPALSSYRTPLQGLYLTGASTHPGGGVFGASGYNTAHRVLRDRGIPTWALLSAAALGAGGLAATLRLLRRNA